MTAMSTTNEMREGDAGCPTGRGAIGQQGPSRAGGTGLPPLDRTAEAFARVRDELMALPAGEVGQVNADVVSVVLTALGAWSNIEPRLGAMRAALPLHDHAAIGRVHDYALALLHAQIASRGRAKGGGSFAALKAEAAGLRERLLLSAEGLAHFGLVDGVRVAAIRRGQGLIDLANDLSALSMLFQASWGAIADKTPVTRAEVERAEELGLRLLEAIGRRKVGNDGSKAPGPYEDERARAFRLLVRAYGQARRALAYLRWDEGDVDRLAPSLFGAARSGRAKVAPGGDATP